MAAVLRQELEADATRGRFNIYTIVHKGLRGFMCDVLVRWGRMDVTDDCERNGTVEHARALLAMCKKHLQHENKFVHTAIERVNPGFTARLAREHVEHEIEIARLESWFVAFTEAPAEQRETFALRIYQQLSAFVAENFEHMLVEETENHRALTEAYTDEEILSIERAIVASIPPEESSVTLRWMIGHVNANERAIWLGGMKRGAPPEVFAGVMALAREVLSQLDYYKLERALA